MNKAWKAIASACMNMPRTSLAQFKCSTINFNFMSKEESVLAPLLLLFLSKRGAPILSSDSVSPSEGKTTREWALGVPLFMGKGFLWGLLSKDPGRKFLTKGFEINLAGVKNKTKNSGGLVSP